MKKSVLSATSKAVSTMTVAAMLSQTLIGPMARAQDEFGGDFNPPPPPDFGGGSVGTPGSFGGTNSGAGGASIGEKGLLNRSQKEKFAKAGIEDITDANFPETIESFDFPNADIQDIVKAISELTGKNFIIDNGLRGKITIIAPSKITVAEAYKAFLSALAINGYAIVPQGKFLKIRSARNAQRDSIETYSGAYYPNSDTMITRIIHLKHIQAEAVNRDLRILSSKDGEMSVYPPTNSIILSDYGSNIDRVMKIINQLDVPGFEDQMEVIKVNYAKAKDIADLIDKIVNKGQGGSGGSRAGAGGFTAGVPRFPRSSGTQGSAGSSYFMVIPDDRTNSLIVTGNKTGIARIKKLLGQLDFRIRPEDAGGVYVYYVRNGDAKKIAATLQGVAKDAAPKPATGAGTAAPVISPTAGVQAPQEIFGGDVKITADEGTNSLVVVASKPDYEVVLSLLRKIDIPRDQVYVEAVIMEMKATDEMNYQIGYFKFDKSGAKAGFNGFTSTSLNDLLSPTGGNGTILGFGSGDTVTVPVSPGSTQTVTLSSILGFVNFLKTNRNANILSTPQLLALDAQEAMIEVGDKVVIGSTASGGANGANPVVTPQFEDATIQLKIKPFISPTTGTIRMELKSNIKQLSVAKTPTAFASSTQPLATRKLETNIVVRNGDTAVLGGLMKEDDVETITKVPLLGDIPILGWLFKSRSASKEKTNMLIFLTPKILRSPADADNLLGQKIDQRQDYIKGVGGRDPYGFKIDEIQKSRAKAPVDTENP
jgi:general secretion pathway protein D